MRWAKLFDRYSLTKRPTLRAANPRLGTSIIPLDMSDGEIFFQYLTNKIHALSFEGSEKQLRQIIEKLECQYGFKIHKFRSSASEGKRRLLLVHLKFHNDLELRRVIRLH